MEQKILTNGLGGTLIIFLTSIGDKETAKSVFNKVITQRPDENITFAVYEADEWDRDYSPWEYKISDTRKFFGDGVATLSDIKTKYHDVVNKYKYVFIAGYSLAGLFSLWAIHEEDRFDGCACCSGSLWFEGFSEYLEKDKLKKPGIVYLSLGGKEEKTPDSILSTIGIRTKSTDKLLEKDPMVMDHTLVVNPGGHFASPDKRLARGIIWLIDNKYKIVKG